MISFIPIILPHSFSLPLLKCYAPIESWMYGQYTHVACISKVAEKKLREYIGGRWLDKSSDRYHRISTINNGIDVKSISEAAPDAELLSLKAYRKAILMVAGFREAKDQDTVVKALSLLDRSEFEVWFAGIGVRQNIVKHLADTLGIGGRVRFLGLRTDIPNVLRAADMIVMSSHWEGLSLSNIEGMSAHKPFIASKVNGLREVTEGYGILFEHRDARGLAAEIEHLSKDSQYYQQVANACYERAEQFDIDKMIMAYERMYKRIVGIS